MSLKLRLGNHFRWTNHESRSRRSGSSRLSFHSLQCAATRSAVSTRSPRVFHRNAHCSPHSQLLLQIVLRPEIFTETHIACLTLNCCYRLFLYKTKWSYCQQGFGVLLGTRTHLSALKKWMVWALLLNS